MDYKKVLMELLDLCKKGKFTEALNVMDNIAGEVSSTHVISLMIVCCKVCVPSNVISETISPDSLYNLLSRMITPIKDLTESDLFIYFQSLFHILKLFVKEKCYRLISEMEKIIVPLFLPSSMPKKHSDTYQSSAKLLYTLLTKAKDYTEYQILIKISTIISKIYAATNALDLFDMSYSCSICLSHLSCPIKQQQEYFFKVISLVKMSDKKSDMKQYLKYFLLHFKLVYQNILNSYDFGEAKKFYEETLESVEQFKSEVLTKVLKVLKFPLILSPCKFNDKLESLLECKSCLLNSSDSEIEQLLENKLCPLTQTVVMYYKNESDSEWCKLSETCRLECLRFIYDVRKLGLSVPHTCSCNCLLKKNVYQSVCYCPLVSTLLERCIRQITDSAEFYKEGAELLEKFYEDVLKLKDNGCEKWQNAWNTISMALYNNGLYLYKKNNEACLHYIYALIKCFIKLERLGDTTIQNLSVVSSAFLIACNYNSKNYKTCMALSALAIKLCVDQRSTLITHWVKAKCGQRDLKTADSDEMQKVTLVSAFQVLKKEMAFLTGRVNILKPSDKIDLLVLELEGYKRKWRSTVPMTSVINELYEIADLNKLVEVLVEMYGDSELTPPEGVVNIIKDARKRFKAQLKENCNATQENTIFLAVLYHLEYKCYVRDTVKRNMDDMMAVMNVKPTKSDEPPDAMPQDPNEECDIVSTYDSLKLSKYFEVMKHLNKSLDLVATVLKDNFDTSDFKHVSYTTIHNLLMKIAFEYRLHRFKVRTFQALQLALKVAQADNNARNIVNAISYLIETADIKKSYVRYLILLADRQLESIECDSVENLKVILTYYICKAKSLLYQDYKQAYRIFETAMELYEAQEDKSDLMFIKSQLLLLHFKFVLLPCKFGIVDHKKSTLLTVYLANSTMFEEYRSLNFHGPYEMSCLLDANEELVKINHLMSCPREVRAYAKNTIILAQQLVLPIRCAYYLVYLAQADLRSSKFDDCQVKLEGLADILCLAKHAVHIDQENTPSPRLKIVKDVVSLTNEMREMVLDLPVTKNYKKQFSPSSPTLLIEPFKLPTFVSHKNDCDCFYCLSLEYQSLVLEKIRLDAMLHIKHNNFVVATDFFQGALKFYKASSARYESCSETASKYIPYDLIPEFGEGMLSAYGFTLLEYSYHLRRTKDSKSALKTTNNLIDMVSPEQLQHVYLYNAALFQKLGYLTEVPEMERRRQKLVEIDSLCPESAAAPTTPISKNSSVTLSFQRSPIFSPPKRRLKKCLPFNLSPNRENVEKFQESVSPGPKTPALKFKCNVTAVTAEKKNAPQTIHIFNDNGKKTRKKATAKEDLLKVPTIGAAITPISVQPDSAVLRSRTRLLTERLRQSSKKPETSSATVVEESGSKSSRSKLAARKNLFDQQVKADEVPIVAQGGAVRKSTRSRNC